MGTVIPIDEFVTDDWYPGFRPAFGQAPWIVEPFSTFRKQDESRLWFLDFHWPRGLTPMGLICHEDGYAWGTQLAAEHLPLPPGRGVAVRIAGTHTYAAEIRVTSAQERQVRARRFSNALTPFLANFQQLWETRRTEIDEDWKRLNNTDLRGLALPDLCEHLHQTRA